MEERQRENGKGENKKQTGRKRQNENASAEGGLKVKCREFYIKYG